MVVRTASWTTCSSQTWLSVLEVRSSSRLLRRSAHVRRSLITRMKLSTLYASSVVLLLLTVLSAAGCSPSSAIRVVNADFSFKTFLVGQWIIERSTLSLDTGLIEYDEFTQHYDLQQSNDSDSYVVGHFFKNDTSTGQVSDEQDVLIDFSGAEAENAENQGIWSLGAAAPDGEVGDGDFMPIFSFAVVEHHNSMKLAHGIWGQTGSIKYQLAIGADDRFTITVWEGQEGEVVTYTARKILHAAPKTFFQRYGMFIMIAGMMVFNQFIQAKIKNPAMQAAAQGRAAAAGAGGQVAAAASATNKSAGDATPAAPVESAKDK